MPVQVTSPDVLRTVLQGHETTSLQPIINIIDSIVTPQGGASHAASYPLAAAAIAKSWQDDVVANFPTGYTFDGHRWVSLDEADGGMHGAGARVAASATVGTAAGSMTPVAINLVAQKNGALMGRKQKPGRMYLGPVLEAWVDDQGVVLPAQVTAWTGFLEAWRTDVDLTGDLAFDVTLATLHKTFGVAVWLATPITSFSVHTKAGTQVRRFR